MYARNVSTNKTSDSFAKTDQSQLGMGCNTRGHRRGHPADVTSQFLAARRLEATQEEK
jgi:hypothetical protein